MLKLMCDYPLYPHHPQNYPQSVYLSADLALIYISFVNFKLSH